MAQQLINIGSVANDGTGDPLRDAFDKVNDNFTELYSDDMGDVNSVTGSGGLTASPTTGAVVVSLNDDSITYAKLGTEFTTSAGIGASDVNFSTAQVFTKTLTGTTAFTYSNAQVGMVKDLIINADGNSFTLPTGTKIIAGTPTTGINFIQVVVTATGEYWTSISQQQ